jgi:hypothetical protein
MLHPVVVFASNAVGILRAQVYKFNICPTKLQDLNDTQLQHLIQRAKDHLAGVNNNAPQPLAPQHPPPAAAPLPTLSASPCPPPAAFPTAVLPPSAPLAPTTPALQTLSLTPSESRKVCSPVLQPLFPQHLLPSDLLPNSIVSCVLFSSATFTISSISHIPLSAAFIPFLPHTPICCYLPYRNFNILCFSSFIPHRSSHLTTSTCTFPFYLFLSVFPLLFVHHPPPPRPVICNIRGRNWITTRV